MAVPIHAPAVSLMPTAAPSHIPVPTMVMRTVSSDSKLQAAISSLSQDGEVIEVAADILITKTFSIKGLIVGWVYIQGSSNVTIDDCASNSAGEVSQ